MKFAVFFFLLCSAAAFSYLVYNHGSGSESEEISDVQAQRGKLLWQSYNCQACHQIYGLGGYMGPDLTNVISTPGKGPDYVNALLTAGTAKMPNFHLTGIEKQQLVAFLTAVSKSGEYPLKTENIDLKWGSFLIRKMKKN